MKSSEQFIRQRELEEEDKKTKDRENFTRLEYILNKSNQPLKTKICPFTQKTNQKKEN